LKRHKREVSRARNRCRPSEPDLRTPEQLAAAREASRAVGGRRAANLPLYATPSTPTPPAHRAGTEGTIEAEVTP